MSHPSNFGLVDLIIILAVIGAAVATLRRGGGALATLGSVLATLLVAWLVTVAMAAWAPSTLPPRGATGSGSGSRPEHSPEPRSP